MRQIQLLIIVIQLIQLNYALDEFAELARISLDPVFFAGDLVVAHFPLASLQHENSFNILKHAES